MFLSKHSSHRLSAGLLLLAVLTASPAAAAQEQQAEPAPARHLIEGVPFVSWSEATKLDFPDKDVLNPSVPASITMISRYWGHESLEESWAVTEGESGGTIEVLKTWVQQDVPVFIVPALTPSAHPLSPVVAVLWETGVIKGARPPRSRPTSGMLSTLVSIELLAKLEGMPVNPFQEASLLAARVVIGYDDEEGVLILHDPSFGPALEVPYAELDQMWQPAGASYAVAHPRDPTASPARPATGPYPEPSPDQQALRHWVYGYALASVGRLEEAAQEYDRGLELEDISAGCRHLLLLELALYHRAKGDHPTAIEMARQGAELVPEHFRGWQLLGDLYTESSLKGRKKIARDYTARAKRLRADTQAMEIAGGKLPHAVLYLPAQRRPSRTPPAS